MNFNRPKVLAASVMLSCLSLTGCNRATEKPLLTSAAPEQADKKLREFFGKGPIDIGVVSDPAISNAEGAVAIALKTASQELGLPTCEKPRIALELARKFNVPLGVVIRDDKAMLFPADVGALMKGDRVAVSRRATFLVGWLDPQLMDQAFLSGEREAINAELSAFF